MMVIFFKNGFRKNLAQDFNSKQESINFFDKNDCFKLKTL